MTPTDATIERIARALFKDRWFSDGPVSIAGEEYYKSGAEVYRRQARAVLSAMPDIQSQIAAAVAEERQRCAEVAEKRQRSSLNAVNKEQYAIAAAIRKGPSQ